MSNPRCRTVQHVVLAMFALPSHCSRSRAPRPSGTMFIMMFPYRLAK